ncbi:PRC-barrel domain-containing protein [Actinoplanes philippinensis]|uniref:PRC-barrel domain-containing protein n=1 Tax=Actinoplanes philippinensis TaxID=35752 RepID=A0A1I2K633_9ACTN|nr:PRC-barrel domain-containing protein [Actinoplanes philippinensis]SFF61798.1 PRC-barrel domain-containing protein [Actinoplanes philippinensis]
MTQHTAPEDLGAPVSYLVLKNGTAVYDRSGDEVGTVDHVLADEPANLFHGLLIKTADGHRFAAGDQVDGLFEHGVIVAEPADRLATPSADAPAEQAGNRATGLKRAWEWLIRPK